MRLILLAAALCLVDAEVLQLPSYFKVCARLDPNFDECAMKSGREAIPHLVKGERKLNLPPLDPFEITEIKLSNGKGRGQLNLVLRDIELQGLKDAYLHNISTDFSMGHASFLLTVPQLKMLGTYNIAGQILLLPITGTGNVNITLVDTKIVVPFDFTKEKINGVDHAMLTTITAHLDPTKMYIHFDNLFNGDKLLGEEMNKLLNDNWKEVFDEFAPNIAASFIEVFRGITNALSEQFTFDLLVPETLS